MSAEQQSPQMSQPNDDDGTVLRSGPMDPASGGGGQSLTSNRSPAVEEDGFSLRVGTRVAEFEVTERIGEGGFSIVYLALDHSLERTVALKEYMPSSLAARTGTTQVQPRSQRHRDTFEAGLKSFVNEAKLLAQFDHPALVKVYRFWEANGTAYMVMPFYQGVTVKDAVRALPSPPDEAWLMTLLGPLTQALMVIHSQNCYHRDIAPDNVLLLAGSHKPLLLDFGAARRVIGDMTQALTVILKAGYAPVEQYAEVPGMKQGPWTDVYALAAVIYWAITGKTPPPSVGRMVSDSHVPLAECAAGRYSPRFLQAVDRALAVLPERRTQSIEAFRQDLGLDGDSGSSHDRTVQWQDPEATIIRPGRPRLETAVPGTTGLTDVALPTTQARSRPATWPGQTKAEALPKVAAAPAVQAAALAESGPTVRAQDAQERSTPPTTAEVRRPRRTLVAASVVGAGVLGAAVWWALPKPGAEPSTPVPAPDKPAVTAPPTSEQIDTHPGPAVASPSPAISQPPQIETDPAAPSSAPVVVTPIPDQAVNVPPAPPPPAKPPLRPSAIAAPSNTTTGKPNPPKPPPGNSAECASILLKQSMGDSSANLAERYKALNCR